MLLAICMLLAATQLLSHSDLVCKIVILKSARVLCDGRYIEYIDTLHLTESCYSPLCPQCTITILSVMSGLGLGLWLGT